MVYRRRVFLYVRFIASMVFVALFAASIASAQIKPTRPPNGTYVYSLHEGKGPAIFKSTIVVTGTGSTFSMSEKAKLPNGAIATTQSTWFGATLLPVTFDVYQGKTTLHARISPTKLTLVGRGSSFARISGSTRILPSVGLISTDIMFAYVVNAYPRESLTLAEIQNNQSVLVRRDGPRAQRHGYTAIVMIKQEKHGSVQGQEHIVAWLNHRSALIEEIRANPGDARITLDRFARS